MSPTLTYAINLHSIYTSACSRKLGVIVDVNESHVKMLSLNGKFSSIPRHDIIYITYYSITGLPSANIDHKNSVKIIKIKTLHENKLVDLVSGWPVDYSETRISFLSLDGREIVIARDNIWKVNITDMPKSARFINKSDYDYFFVHPYIFRHCPDINKNHNMVKKLHKVYPQQSINEPIKIKKELDRLQAGRKRVKKYKSAQQFYAIPHIYTNNTSLGYWFSYGSRYGSSKSRKNNYSPILQNEFSSGPFGYQHLFLTGSAPMYYSLHDEPQTQIYYRLKADYYHMAIMFDPNFLLLSYNKYNWDKKDLSKYDDRFSQMSFAEIGFDYWKISLQGYLSINPIGIRNDNYFADGTAYSLRVGTTYQNHLFKIELQAEVPKKDQNKSNDYSSGYGFYGVKNYLYSLNGYRLNIESRVHKNISLIYSIIYRNLNFRSKGKITSSTGMLEHMLNEYKNTLVYLKEDLENMITSGAPQEEINKKKEEIQNYENTIERINDNIKGFEEESQIFQTLFFKYKSKSVTNSVYLKYFLSKKYTLGCFASLEYHKNNYVDYDGTKGKSSHYYPKFGINASLTF